MESTARSTRRPAVAQVVRDHSHRSVLGALCFDVIRRQARGRALFSGRKYMRARARDHRLERKQAATELGHVLEILERGPQNAGEAELVAAFAVDGLGRELEGSEADAVADEFVEIADWLALATPYEPYRHAAALLSERARECLARALERSFAEARWGGRPAAWVRLEALAALDDEARTRLTHLSASLDDEVLAAAARALVGARLPSTVAAPAISVGVEGEMVSAAGASPWRVLGWVTGWALLRRLALGLVWLLGLRRTAAIWVDGRVVRCERTTSLLGRQVHVIDESLRCDEVAAVVRELRYPAWVAVIGALCAAAGLFGFLFAIDASLRLGSAGPLLWGLGALGLGAGLDLLFDFYLRSRGPSVWLEICAPGRRPLRIADVDPHAASQIVLGIEEGR